jgi:hypothetical protein
MFSPYSYGVPAKALIRIDLEIAKLREDVASGRISQSETQVALDHLLREREWCLSEIARLEAEKQAPISNSDAAG